MVNSTVWPSSEFLDWNNGSVESFNHSSFCIMTPLPMHAVRPLLSPYTTLRCDDWQLLTGLFLPRLWLTFWSDTEIKREPRGSHPGADRCMRWAWHRAMLERLEGGLSGSLLEALKWFPTFKYLDCVSLLLQFLKLSWWAVEEEQEHREEVVANTKPE